MPQTIIHLAWRLEEQRRQIIFGWVETLPAHLPNQEGHNYKSLDLRSSGNGRLYVQRFATESMYADAWFNEIQNGKMSLPKDENDSDGSPAQKFFKNAGWILEPADGRSCFSMDLPFLPALHGVAKVVGLFGKIDQRLLQAIQAPNARSWLQEHLFFDILDYEEYLGAIVHTKYDDYVRHVDTRLNSDSEHETQLVRVIYWPRDKPLKMTLTVLELRPLGVSKPLQQPIELGLVAIRWTSTVDQTCFAIIDENDNPTWWSNPGTFVKRIVAKFNPMIGRTKVQLTATDGVIIDSYAFDQHAPESKIIIGNEQLSPSVTARLHQIKWSRSQRALAKSAGLQWFDDSKTAADEIRNIIQRGKHRIWIVDPYCASNELIRFALIGNITLKDRKIYTSADFLRTRNNKTKKENGDVLSDVLRQLQFSKQQIPEVWVMPGASRVHDRFLVVDDEIWSSGNSLNEIGRRASILVRLPAAQLILPKLREALKEAVPFQDWISKRQHDRSQNSLS